MAAYWEKRCMLRQAVYDREAENTIRMLTRAYDLAQKQIFLDIQNIIGNFQKYFGLTEREARALLNEPAPRDVLKELKRRLTGVTGKEARRRIEAQLSAPAYRARISRMEAMRLSAQTEMAKVAKVEIEADRACLMNVAQESYYRTSYDFQHAAGRMVRMDGMSVSRAQEILRTAWSGANYSARIWHNTHKTASSISRALVECCIQGKTSEETFRALMRENSRGRYGANRLLRTEMNYVAGQGEALAYRDAGVKEYRFMAVLDGRTSALCQALDGQVFPLSRQQVGVNMHPMHPFCRSSTAPVVPWEDREGKRRWARDPVTGKEEYVSQDMTYEQWRDKLNEKYGVDTVDMARKKVQHATADTAQWKRYQKVLGGKNVPKTIDQFQEMKYNHPGAYATLKRAYGTIGEIDGKGWSDAFKGRAKKAYWDLRQHDIEISAHGVGRMLSRKNKDGSQITVQQIVQHIGKPENYLQEDGRAIRFYGGVATVSNPETKEIISVIRRDTKKAEWRAIK